MWYYDTDEDFILRDIYNIRIVGYIQNNYFYYYPFRLESKYRYSGLLYDKLKHILSYIYRNVLHYPPASKPETSRGDYLYYAELIFKLEFMCPIYYDEVCIKKIVTVDYLPESVAQSLYFMHP